MALRRSRCEGSCSRACMTKPHPIVFGNILRVLNHVYAMDLVWRAHLLGTPHAFTTRSPEECPPFAELRAAQRTSTSGTSGIRTTCRKAPAARS
jgi:uncharacterized damage-inducible protein DinB